ncbi:MAG: HEAT repeat domain-containing protein [Planctomycetota bacterium]
MFSNHKDIYVRELSVCAIEKIREANIIPCLIETLRNAESEEERETIARTLGEMGVYEAIPNLIKALNDDSWLVRRLAAYALGILGAREAIPQLIRILNDDIEDIDTRKKAAHALGNLGAIEAIPHLIKVFNNVDSNIKSTFPSSDENVMMGSSNINSLPSEYELHILGYQMLSLRFVTAEALGKLGATQIIPDLIKLLDGNEYEQPIACLALADLRAREAIPQIMKTITKNGSDAHRIATIALIELGEIPTDPKNTILLIQNELLNRGLYNEDMRNHAINALNTLRAFSV